MEAYRIAHVGAEQWDAFMAGDQEKEAWVKLAICERMSVFVSGWCAALDGATMRLGCVRRLKMRNVSAFFIFWYDEYEQPPLSLSDCSSCTGAVS